MYQESSSFENLSQNKIQNMEQRIYLNTVITVLLITYEDWAKAKWTVYPYS